MAERRSNRQKKPVVPFDEIVCQSTKPAKPAKPQTSVLKAQEPHYDLAPAESSNNEAIQRGPMQLLCEQTHSLNMQAHPTENSPGEPADKATEDAMLKAANEAVDLEDLKAKRKAKAEEVAGLKML
jgi:hypothetical protein